MQGLSQIGNLPQDIACSWMEIWWLGEVRNKMLLQGLVQRLVPSYGTKGVWIVMAKNYSKWF